jgi:hypothetical protein
MRKSTDHDHAAADPDDEADDSDWLAQYPSETVEAVPVSELAAGVTVTRYDRSEIDEEPIVEIHQHYPPGDDAEGESVYIYTDAHALGLVAALAAVVADRDAVPQYLQEDSDAN